MFGIPYKGHSWNQPLGWDSTLIKGWWECGGESALFWVGLCSKCINFTGHVSLHQDYTSVWNVVDLIHFLTNIWNTGFNTTTGLLAQVSLWDWEGLKGDMIGCWLYMWPNFSIQCYTLGTICLCFFFWSLMYTHILDAFLCIHCRHRTVHILVKWSQRFHTRRMAPWIPGVITRN